MSTEMDCGETPEEAIDSLTDMVRAQAAELRVLRPEAKELRAQRDELLEAVRFAESYTKHSCNIEYGNDTGSARCVACRLLAAIARAEGRKS